MTPAARRKPRKKPHDPAAPVKFAVPLPAALHRALAIASLDTGISQSTLIRRLIEERFTPGQAARPLNLLMPPSWQRAALTGAGWRLVSVFLPAELRDRATLEVRRQHGAGLVTNGDAPKRWNAGSLAAAAAALVAERYAPEVKF